MYGRPPRPGDPAFPSRLPPPPRNTRPAIGAPGFPDQRQYFSPAFRPSPPTGFVPGPHGAANFIPPQHFQPQRRPELYRGARHPAPRGPRSWGNRGRGGYNKGEANIEAYYNHSMVEDPWKGLEKKYKENTGNG